MAVETAKKQGSIKPRRMKTPKPFKKRIEPWLWLMPALVFFLVFTYYPFIKTVVSSFFVVNKMGVFKQFAGFDNYVRVLKDRSFQTAIQNTFIYVLLASPVSILIALLLALIAAKKRTMSVAYETLFAVTMAMSMSVSAMIFKLAYNPNIGILNYILGVKINWLNDKHYAMVAISIIATWMNVGYNFIFLLAAVRNIPPEILESCELDGARPFHRTVNIILPMISPTTFYLICTSLAKSMMMSGLVLIFTGGASLNTTANIDTMISYMYKQSVNNLNYNKGYAAAIIAFLMTIVVMLISFRFEKKGVHYSYDGAVFEDSQALPQLAVPNHRDWYRSSACQPDSLRAGYLVHAGGRDSDHPAEVYPFALDYGQLPDGMDADDAAALHA